MCRKRIRLIVLRSLALGLFAQLLGFLAPCVSARSTFFESESSTISSRHHSRRGISHPAADQKLMQLKQNLQNLQNDFAEATMNTYDIDEPFGVFEISALPPPEPAQATDRRHRGGHHRLRHQDKRRRGEENHVQESTSQRDEEATTDGFGFKVNAAVHRTAQNSEEQYFERAVQDSGQSISAEHRASHSYMGVLHSRKRKVCPPSQEGKERLMCPTRNAVGYDVCINVDQLCDHKKDCPNGEDESQVNCLFYKTTMGHFKKVVDAVVSLTDHMVKSERTKREL